jgi:L-asparaginase
LVKTVLAVLISSNCIFSQLFRNCKLFFNIYHMTSKKIVILGTGGTIAGTANQASNNIDYTAAQLGISQLVSAVAGLGQTEDIHTEQVAQIDSKDMSFEVWTLLASRVQQYLAQDDVQGVVITHGTDTLEETAYFLHAVLSPTKPVVLTCAMRPASALAPDGPQNILDAVTVARFTGAQGVVAVCAGVIHSALDVQKMHTYQLNAFSSGDAGAIGFIEENSLELVRNWPVAQQMRARAAPENIAILNTVESWPRVEIVMNYAGASGAMVEALVAQGVQGLVVAGTGNGTVHHALEAALLKAQAQGVRVVRARRCAQGRVLAREDDLFPSSNGLNPVKARIDLMLRLMNIGSNPGLQA